jgi:hypothetical protein
VRTDEVLIGEIEPWRADGAGDHALGALEEVLIV